MYVRSELSTSMTVKGTPYSRLLGDTGALMPCSVARLFAPGGVLAWERASLEFGLSTCANFERVLRTLPESLHLRQKIASR